ncbi:unnamed protein product [Hymenolepis diminuta]|uniref:Uncharacterized protein n=1 Tax=Hymenolepis diminuta TaxID=6216 RepID=A0A0R3SPS7_HYMDI|nr:unnamed protein product [Hymenolepis diminuta]
MRMQRTPSNLFDLDWLGQPGLFNLPINVACNSVHSATSIISFTAGVMVRIYPEVIYDGHGLRNHIYNASRLQRWLTILVAYVFDIEYWNIAKFEQVDYLSRLIYNQKCPDEETTIAV